MVDIKFLFAYFLRKTILNFPVHQSGETSVQPKLPPATSTNLPNNKNVLIQTATANVTAQKMEFSIKHFFSKCD